MSDLHANIRPRLVESFVCAVLALFATAISVMMAAKAGVRTAESDGDQVLWAAFGVMPVLAAHWLPAATRTAPPRSRAAAGAMWVVCMVYAIYAHASYFLLTQEGAGDRRAEAVAQSSPSNAQRPVSAILQDEAKAREELTKVSAAACQSCEWVQNRATAIRIRIQALQAEAEESHAARAARDRVDRDRDDRRADPVMSALVTLLGADRKAVALAFGVLFAMLLDGLASLCWLLVRQTASRSVGGGASAAGEARRQDERPRHDQESLPVISVTMTPSVEPAIRQDGPAPETVSVSGRLRTFENQVHSTTAAAKLGSISPTVAGIRGFLKCSQATASAVRKEVLRNIDRQ